MVRISVQTLERHQKESKNLFGDGVDTWPKFFTTRRWVLWEGAERHLEKIAYQG